MIVLEYFFAKMPAREELVHDEGAVEVAPPEELDDNLVNELQYLGDELTFHRFVRSR